MCRHFVFVDPGRWATWKRWTPNSTKVCCGSRRTTSQSSIWISLSLLMRRCLGRWVGILSVNEWRSGRYNMTIPWPHHCKYLGLEQEADLSMYNDPIKKIYSRQKNCYGWVDGISFLDLFGVQAYLPSYIKSTYKDSKPKVTLRDHIFSMVPCVWKMSKFMYANDPCAYTEPIGVGKLIMSNFWLRIESGCVNSIRLEPRLNVFGSNYMYL